MNVHFFLTIHMLKESIIFSKNQYLVWFLFVCQRLVGSSGFVDTFNCCFVMVLNFLAHSDSVCVVVFNFMMPSKKKWSCVFFWHFLAKVGRWFLIFWHLLLEVGGWVKNCVWCLNQVYTTQIANMWDNIVKLKSKKNEELSILRELKI